MESNRWCSLLLPFSVSVVIRENPCAECRETSGRRAVRRRCRAPEIAPVLIANEHCVSDDWGRVNNTQRDDSNDAEHHNTRARFVRGHDLDAPPTSRLKSLTLAHEDRPATLSNPQYIHIDTQFFA
jgi:hypothetical protein